MRVLPSRTRAREGVNSAQALFESNGCVFQEVAQQNDFGKDAYVDLVEHDNVSHLCAALQIKSGESYKRSKGDYFIPIDEHASTWRRSTVPVFGLVYDPSDSLIRWVDITNYLRTNVRTESGSIPVRKDSILDSAAIHGAFLLAVREHEGNGSIALNLLSKQASVQLGAVFDSWALGRRESRYMLILRRMILELDYAATRDAIVLLSHCGSHPDIFWTPNNWIPPEIEKLVTPSFRWSTQEVWHMLETIDVEEWGRGSLGQCLDVLLHEDPDALSTLHESIRILLDNGRDDLAVRAATLALVRVPDQRKEILVLSRSFPQLVVHEWFTEIAATIRDHGFISFY